jgi:hypothetical protein
VLLNSQYQHLLRSAMLTSCIKSIDDAAALAAALDCRDAIDVWSVGTSLCLVDTFFVGAQDWHAHGTKFEL